MWGLCNHEPNDWWPLWLQARPICRPALWRLWNHREVRQGPSSNNCSVLKRGSIPTAHTTQHCPAVHQTSATLRGRAAPGLGVGRGDQPLGFSVDQGTVEIGWTCLTTQTPVDTQRLCALQWQIWEVLSISTFTMSLKLYTDRTSPLNTLLSIYGLCVHLGHYAHCIHLWRDCSCSDKQVNMNHKPSQYPYSLT